MRNVNFSFYLVHSGWMDECIVINPVHKLLKPPTKMKKGKEEKRKKEKVRKSKKKKK